jgi:hypothetical protein
MLNVWDFLPTLDIMFYTESEISVEFWRLISLSNNVYQIMFINDVKR